jgi:hypothetical protein
MFFYDLGAALAMAEAAREEERRFAERVAELPADLREKLVADRAALKERNRREALEERRHQELCAAIRKSGFWP